MAQPLRKPRRLVDHGSTIYDVYQPPGQPCDLRHGDQPQRHHRGLPEAGREVYGQGQVRAQQSPKKA